MRKSGKKTKAPAVPGPLNEEQKKILAIKEKKDSAKKNQAQLNKRPSSANPQDQPSTRRELPPRPNTAALQQDAAYNKGAQSPQRQGSTGLPGGPSPMPRLLPQRPNSGVVQPNVSAVQSPSLFTAQKQVSGFTKEVVECLRKSNMFASGKDREISFKEDNIIVRGTDKRISSECVKKLEGFCKKIKDSKCSTKIEESENRMLTDMVIFNQMELELKIPSSPISWKLLKNKKGKTEMVVLALSKDDSKQWAEKILKWLADNSKTASFASKATSGERYYPRNEAYDPKHYNEPKQNKANDEPTTVRLFHGQQQLIYKYLKTFRPEFLKKICLKHYLECELVHDHLVLTGRRIDIENVKEELKKLADNIVVSVGHSFYGKPVIEVKIRQHWEAMEEKEQCLIHVERSQRPEISCGCIAYTEAVRLNILYMVGSMAAADVDVILCPVSDQMEPLGVTASFLLAGQLNKKAQKKLKTGGVLQIYNPEITCCRWLFVFQEQYANSDDKSMDNIANEIVEIMNAENYRSLALSLDHSSSSFFKALKKRSIRLNFLVNVLCFGNEDYLDLLHKNFKSEKDYEWFEMDLPITKGCETSKVKVDILEGSILDIKVEVIVNSVGIDLDLKNGQVSKLLVKKGGEDIQKQCDEHVKKYGFGVGQIAITKGWRLDCKFVFHIALCRNWISDGNISIEILKNLMIKCLDEAEKRELSSIAFPALGTGLLGYPTCLVAKAMLDAVDKFEKTGPKYLKSVQFVLFDKDLSGMFQRVKKWHMRKKPQEFIYDVPPRHGLHVDTELDTRILVSDINTYSQLAYKELRIEFSEKESQDKLDWDVQSGCFTRRLRVPKNEKESSHTYRSLIRTMQEERFPIVDIVFDMKIKYMVLQQHIMDLITELQYHAEEIDRLNQSRAKNVLPIINYVKTVRIFVESGDYEEFVQKCNEDTGESSLFWHITDNPKFAFDIEVVGDNTKVHDVLHKIQHYISPLEVTSNCTLKEPVKNAEVSKNRTNSIEIAEDMYFEFLYITDNENWWSAISEKRYDNGRLFLKFKNRTDADVILQMINDKIEKLRQLVGADIPIPPGSEDNIKNKITMLQGEVRNIAPDVLCFLSKDQSRINIKGKSYEQVQQAKYMVEVNLGMKKSVGRRTSRKFASPEDELVAPARSQNGASNNVNAVSNNDNKDCLAYRTAEGIPIYVYCTGILDLKVDVLVNAANKDLQHGGGIAYHISNAAGYQLEKECEDYISHYGPLYAGTCCSTTAGNLPYKFIIHAVGPMWHSYTPNKKGQCLYDLRMTILAALEEANMNGCQSIAIPAISSGIFGVPKELCTEEYAQAVKEYSQKFYKKSYVREIHFIDKDRSMCHLIQKTFDKEFGRGRPHEM